MKTANRIKAAQQGNYLFDKTRSANYHEATKKIPLNTEIGTPISLINTNGVTGSFVNAVALRPRHNELPSPDCKGK
jgi:hypothetical protein